MRKKLKTCVYTIALNEEKHAERFMSGNVGADYVLVADTGSSDKTVDILKKCGAIVHTISVKPWRFDVARNTALALIPPDVDICLSVDLDEILQPGWVDVLNTQTDVDTTRIFYTYIWNWKPDGVTPDVRFHSDKIHSRFGYRWRHPCHETLYPEHTTREKIQTLSDLVLHHRADPTKSRGQYLHLLDLATKEDPQNDRMAHYYGRELMFRGEFQKSIDEFKRHLSLPSARWREERAASMRYIGNCYKNLNDVSNAIDWYWKAIHESSTSREPWLSMMEYCYDSKDWDTGYWAAKKCLSISQKGNSYISSGRCWDHTVYDFASIHAWNAGNKQDAINWGIQAWKMNPTDQRLKANCIAMGVTFDSEGNPTL